MSANQQTHYEVLGLPQDASMGLIEKQSIRLGERYRPEKNSGDLFRDSLTVSAPKVAN